MPLSDAPPCSLQRPFSIPDFLQGDPARVLAPHFSFMGSVIFHGVIAMELAEIFTLDLLFLLELQAIIIRLDLIEIDPLLEDQRRIEAAP